MLRPDRNGGMSMCSSREDRVGHGRCTHLIDNDNPAVPVVYSKETRSYQMDVTDVKTSKTEDQKVDSIKNYFKGFEVNENLLKGARAFG